MTLTLVQPKQQEMVDVPDLSSVMMAQEEFHGSFEIPVSETMADLYVRLIDEEHEEWIEEYYDPNAYAYDELKELTDLLYVTAGLAYQESVIFDKVEKFSKRKRYDDGITDFVSDIVTGNVDKDTISGLIYCIYGYAQYMGWDLNKSYVRVHQSNMSKLGDDGKPVRRDDGKVLKGPNYLPPDLKDLTDASY